MTKIVTSRSRIRGCNRSQRIYAKKVLALEVVHTWCIDLIEYEIAVHSENSIALKILDFSRSGLKHQPHDYVGHIVHEMAEIVLLVAA